MGFSAASGNSTPSVRARVWVRPRVRRPSRRHSTAPVWPTGAETFRVWPWREGVPIFLCECLGRAWGPPALNPPASPAAAALPAHTHPHMYVHWYKPESAERVRAECMPAHRTRAPGLPVCAPPAHPCLHHPCVCLHQLCTAPPEHICVTSDLFAVHVPESGDIPSHTSTGSCLRPTCTESKQLNVHSVWAQAPGISRN